MQNLSPAIQFKASTVTKAGEFEGHGAVFGNVDLGGDRIMPGAFGNSLDEHKRDGTTPAMLWSHDPSEPIGRWLEIREDSVGLKVRGKLTLETARAKSAHALMRDDALALSIGYAAEDFDYDRDGVRVLKEVSLFEVSTVAMPMNRRARITDVKSIGNVRSFEAVLREIGFSAREAKRLASGGWGALNERGNQSSELETLRDEMRELGFRIGS